MYSNGQSNAYQTHVHEIVANVRLFWSLVVHVHVLLTHLHSNRLSTLNCGSPEGDRRPLTGIGMLGYKLVITQFRQSTPL